MFHLNRTLFVVVGFGLGFFGVGQKKNKCGFIFSFCKLLSYLSLRCCDVAKIDAIMLNYVFTPPFTILPPLSFIYNYHGCLSRNSRIYKGLPVPRFK